MHEILAPSDWMAELPQISVWLGLFLLSGLLFLFFSPSYQRCKELFKERRRAN